MIRAEKSHILSDGLFFDQVNIGYQPHLQVVGNQIMEMFNFISDEDFRTSLEADYQELTLCMNAGAWKAVHVLAGSIVETLLIDYLVATEYEKRSSRKFSAMNFFEIIDICKKEHALSSKSADLSNAIREYRNLIHPEN